MIDRSLTIQLAKKRLHAADRIDPVDSTDILTRLREFLADLNERNTADITDSVVLRSRELLGDVGGDTSKISNEDAVKRAKLLLADLYHNQSPVDQSVVLTQTRDLLADNIEPYRWPDDQLSEFYDQGLIEINKIRYDISAPENVTEDFSAALSHYIASRAVSQDNDYQQNNGALSEKFFKQFVDLTSLTPFHWNDSDLTEYAEQGIAEIRKLRNDIGTVGTVSVEFTEALSFYIASRAFNLNNEQKSNNGAITERLYSRFTEFTSAVPFRLSEEQLKKFASIAIEEIKKTRQDAALYGVGTDFLEPAGYYTAFLAENLTMDQTRNNGNHAERFRIRFAETLQLVPFHWTDEQLEKFIQDGIEEIKPQRTDVGNDGIVTIDYSDAIVRYAAGRAVLMNRDLYSNGTSLSDKMFQQFRELVTLVPMQYPESRFDEWFNRSLNVLLSLRPELMLNENGSCSTSIEQIPDRFADPIADYITSLGFMFYNKVNEASIYRESAAASFKML